MRQPLRPDPGRRPRFARGLLLALAVALATAGCDENDLGLNGEFVATVSGDVKAEYAGDAFYTVYDSDTGPVFVLLFLRNSLSDNTEDEYAYVALWREGPLPGTGVYPVESAQTAPAAFAGAYTDLVDAESPDASGPAVSATDGVLTITDQDTGELTGSFRFDGQGLFLPDTDDFIAASVSGTFEARYLAPGSVFALPIDFAFD
jgi:hypothetical protein